MRMLYENCLTRNKQTNVIDEQGLKSEIGSVDNYINTLSPFPVHKRAKLIFNSLGYSYDRANLYHIILELNKLSILTTKNFNSIFIGEGELGKSFLVLNILNLYCYKMTGELNLVHLRGSKTGCDKDNIVPLLEELFLILEEQFKNLKPDVISVLKDALESGYFKNNKDELTKVLINLIIIGNTPDKTKINSMDDLNFSNILEDFNRAWTSDKAAMQRIDAIFPHFSLLLGMYKEERNFHNGEVLSTIDLKDTLFLLRDLEVNIPEKYFAKLGSRESLSIKKISSSLIKILFPDKLNCLEDYQYEGILEIAKHFHWIGNSDKKSYSPFNKKSLKFFCSLVTSIESIEFAQMLHNRLIIKKEGEPFLRKYALNGFGIRENEKEDEFSKNKTIVSPIIEVKNKGWLLKQEIDENFKYRPINAIYFNNYKKSNLIEEAKDNENILKIYELASKASMTSYLDGIEFKGIPYHVELKIVKRLEYLEMDIKNISNIRNHIAYSPSGDFKVVNIP